MWSAATCHWRERHHEARIGLRTALESTASEERNRTLASARRSRDVCGGVDACAISPPHPKFSGWRLSLARRLSLRGSDSALPAPYKVNPMLRGTVSS